VARVNTAAVAVNPPLVYSQTMHRKFPPDYPPYGYHFKTSSVASSIYSEPIHSRSSLPMKQVLNFSVYSVLFVPFVPINFVDF